MMDKQVAVDENGIVDTKPRDNLFQKLLKLLPEFDPDALWKATAVEPHKWWYLQGLTHSKNHTMLREEISDILMQQEHGNN